MWLQIMEGLFFSVDVSHLQIIDVFLDFSCAIIMFT